MRSKKNATDFSTCFQIGEKGYVVKRNLLAILIGSSGGEKQMLNRKPSGLL